MKLRTVIVILVVINAIIAPVDSTPLRNCNNTSVRKHVHRGDYAGAQKKWLRTKICSGLASIGRALSLSFKTFQKFFNAVQDYGPVGFFTVVPYRPRQAEPK